MVKDKQCCAMKLLGLVQKIMNESTYEVVDDAVGSLVESLHNVLLIRGDDFDSLPKYLEASEYRHAALDGDGFEAASPKFCDACMEELVNCGQELGRTYLALKGWKEALDDDTVDREIAAGKKA